MKNLIQKIQIIFINILNTWNSFAEFHKLTIIAILIAIVTACANNDDEYEDFHLEVCPSEQKTYHGHCVDEHLLKEDPYWDCIHFNGTQASMCVLT